VQAESTHAEKLTAIETTEEFKTYFDKGEISTRISPQKQARHMYGTKQFEEYVNNFKSKGSNNLPSYFREDLRYDDLKALVVDRLNGNVSRKGDGSFVEFVTCDENVGYYYSPSRGRYISTKCVQVKYSLSDKNIHIIPVKEFTKGENLHEK